MFVFGRYLGDLSKVFMQQKKEAAAADAPPICCQIQFVAQKPREFSGTFLLRSSPAPSLPRAIVRRLEAQHSQLLRQSITATANPHN